jgi:hypothetical protein
MRLGLNVDSYRGVRRVSHGGSWAGFRAQLSRFPERKVSVFTLCNLANSAPSVLTTAVADLMLDLGPATVAAARPSGREGPGAVSAADRAALAGEYHSDELLADWRLFGRGDSLFVRPGLGPEVQLRFTGRDTLNALGTRITVLRAGDRVAALALDNRGLRNFKLTRVP